MICVVSTYWNENIKYYISKTFYLDLLLQITAYSLLTIFSLPPFSGRAINENIKGRITVSPWYWPRYGPGSHFNIDFDIKSFIRRVSPLHWLYWAELNFILFGKWIMQLQPIMWHEFIVREMTNFNWNFAIVTIKSRARGKAAEEDHKF